MMFHVDQKVVCIHDEWLIPPDICIPAFPVKNSVYTVKRLDHAGLFLCLHEIGEPYSWLATCFRPVIARKT